MSFSTDVKDELLSKPPERGCCEAADAAGFALTASGVSVIGLKRYALTLTNENPAIVRYYYTLLKRVIGVSGQLQTVRSERLNDKLRYRLRLAESEAGEALAWMGLIDQTQLMGVRVSPPQALMRRECCRRAYLRGAFLACGWVAEPRKQYHIEFACPDEGQAKNVSRVLRRSGVPTKITERKGRSVVYAKEAELVTTVLGLMGAHKAYLAFEAVRVVKDVKNGVNRQLNCDESNTNKAVSAAASQVADIALISEYGLLETLPAPLRQIAAARLANQDATLSELGALLVPPVGKSGANNRMRRISALATELRDEHGLSE